MNGKPIFKGIKKPKDLFPLPQDTIYRSKPFKYDRKRAEKAVKQHIEWQQQQKN